MTNERTFRIGDASVSVLNVGDITLPLPGSIRAPSPPTGMTAVQEAIAQHRLMPMQDVLITLGDEIVLVDAGEYDLDAASSYAVPGYQPPPPIETRLRAMGIRTEQVRHVVITHRHWDHFNGTGISDGPNRRPKFPDARHYLGRADWPAIEARLSDATTREARSIGLVHAAGLLQLVDGDLEIARGITIVRAPGETPGHQMLRVSSSGETVFAVGDIYHHPIEIEHSNWMVNWADLESNMESRRRLVASAIPSRAAIIASHIPSIGRVVGSTQSARWEALPM